MTNSGRLEIFLGSYGEYQWTSKTDLEIQETIFTVCRFLEKSNRSHRSKRYSRPTVLTASFFRKRLQWVSSTANQVEEKIRSIFL
ncbi:hypothetical protein KUF71_011498 [Frankliniella fusca]|uniref:Uncharacterized protein n=1 Tax=Frankliniella fusca TaxID=407009 RepID=A0AAE1I392_9NEOP|nr:hypothetical protein KUF71_011498 [Frankliniella fusca]